MFEKYSQFTDKETSHSYGQFYEELVRPLRNRPSRILLLGCTLYGGGDALGFLDHLPEALVHCVDVGMQAATQELQQHPRAVFHLRDAYNPGTPLELARSNPSLRFDLIIDDCEHAAYKQTLALHLYSHLLSPGGHYVIEDIAELSVEDAMAMAQQRDLFLRSLDFRHVKGRADDVIYCFSKQPVV